MSPQPDNRRSPVQPDFEADTYALRNWLEGEGAPTGSLVREMAVWLDLFTDGLFSQMVNPSGDRHYLALIREALEATDV